MLEIPTYTQQTTLHEALAHVERLVKYRLDLQYSDETPQAPISYHPNHDSYLERMVQKHKLSTDEIAVVLLALVPYLSPSFFSDIIAQYLPNGGEFPEFGGMKGKNHRGIIPTGETAQFILAGEDMEKRITIMDMFREEHVFAKNSILSLGDVPDGEPTMSGSLQLDEEYVQLLTTGRLHRPKMSKDFPAQRIETTLHWEDLILREKTLAQIKEIQTWLDYNTLLFEDYGMKGRIKPGYRVMFFGPPGTGKTLTATLLGKYTQRDVYRIDLSLIVSKYIGETEKNLSKLFDKAKSKDWILFFDEADSIFGKRTNVRDAHDKYANQEVSYLLQRIEAHPGLVLLASNFKSNIDTAFTRRFQSIIEFENPSYTERLQLWKNNLPKNLPLDSAIDIEQIAKTYEITGANIINIIQHAALQTLQKGRDCIDLEALLAGITKEYLKEGKMI